MSNEFEHLWRDVLIFLRLLLWCVCLDSLPTPPLLFFLLVSCFSISWSENGTCTVSTFGIWYSAWPRASISFTTIWREVEKKIMVSGWWREQKPDQLELPRGCLNETGPQWIPGFTLFPPISCSLLLPLSLSLCWSQGLRGDTFVLGRRVGAWRTSFQFRP